jgi:DNA-binding Lrp family transcriptional regulator
MNANKWADIIARNKCIIEEKIENGFYPRTEWEKIWGLATAETLKRIRKLVDAGIMETKKFRVKKSHQSTYPTPHYKLIK